MWPKQVELFMFPDEKISMNSHKNIHVLYERSPEHEAFLKANKNNEKAKGIQGGEHYNYRWDAVKFCHKPFQLHNFMKNHSEGFDGMIWLDADTITHEKIPLDVVLNNLAPENHAIQFLGRSYKYTECGYLYFNLRSGQAKQLIQNWVDFYINGTIFKQREWHDSFLFDLAREQFGKGFGMDLTGHLPRRQGGGHPFVNSFLGMYMDHYKGDARKAMQKPRKNDLHADHKSEYWKKNNHAKYKPRKESKVQVLARPNR